MDKRFVLIMTIMAAVLLGWTYFAQKKSPEQASSAAAPAAATTTTAGQAADTPPPLPMAAPPDHSAFSPEPANSAATGEVKIVTPQYAAVFDESGGRMKSFVLEKYNPHKINPSLADQPLDLVTTPKSIDWPMRLTMTDPAAPNLENAPFIADKKLLTLAPGETGQIVFSSQDYNGLRIQRIFTFSADTYLVKQQVVLTNNGPVSYGDFVTMRLNSAPFYPKPGRYAGMGVLINRKLVTDDVDDAAKTLAKKNREATRIDWAGYMDQYFITALAFADIAEVPGAVPPALSAALQDHGGLAINASQPLNLMPGKTAAFEFNFYYGPKDSFDLKKAGHYLTSSIDMGWFSILAKPIAWLLKWIYTWVGNYGVAIIIVTVFIKILLWPLTAKSYRSMKEMQKLQPKITKLREKYQGDKEAINREIMQLYKSYKINPLGGCLPMVLQIPFFIAFYRVLDTMLELRGAPFILWIQDLAAPDRLFSFGFKIPFFDQPTGIPVLTILMGLSMIIQQKMTPNTMGDPMQAKMMMMMPLVFIVILINMPAGLVLYWLVNNILSIAQQKLINRPNKAAA